MGQREVLTVHAFFRPVMGYLKGWERGLLKTGRLFFFFFFENQQNMRNIT